MNWNKIRHCCKDLIQELNFMSEHGDDESLTNAQWPPSLNYPPTWYCKLALDCLTTHLIESQKEGIVQYLAKWNLSATRSRMLLMRTFVDLAWIPFARVRYRDGSTSQAIGCNDRKAHLQSEEDN